MFDVNFCSLSPSDVSKHLVVIHVSGTILPASAGDSLSIADSFVEKGFDTHDHVCAHVIIRERLMFRKNDHRLSRGLYLLERRTWFIAIFEAALVIASFVVAWMLIHDFSVPGRRVLWLFVPPLVTLRLLTMARFGLLRGWWRYVGLDDVLDIIKSVAAGSLLMLPCLWLLSGKQVFPASVLILEALLTAVFLAGVRVFFRMLAESARETSTMSTRIALIGAGYTAQLIIREATRSGSTYTVVACFDDNPSKKGMKLSGVPVVGAVEDLPDLVAKWNVDEILVAVPSATSAQMRRFFSICKRTGLRFRTVPALRDFIAGQDAMQQVREVEVDDLLGREPVQIDLDCVRKHIRGKVVMVTGAAGSIGSELSRQLLSYEPLKLICVDHNETGMFYLERELSARSEDRVVYTVADIGNADRMRRVCSTQDVEIIFHAAAHKHVPVMEKNVQEAVNNNVFAFLCLLNVAEQTGCKTFVMISSDKAVNPTSIMGCTKRVGELIMSAWPADGMRCVSVRFGNVLGSSGSVVPVFQELIKHNRPLSITHPDIERFFMTIREAVALVLQASAIGSHGDILVLDMGDPIRIVDLAETLIRLSGKSSDEVPIQFTGLRQGEKLFEELFYPTERIHPTECAKIKRTSTFISKWPELEKRLEDLRASMYVDGPAPVRRRLTEIVPESKLMESSGTADEVEKRLVQSAN